LTAPPVKSTVLQRSKDSDVSSTWTGDNRTGLLSPAGLYTPDALV
jgi:hypothetical protein